jgi:hypothetical protein
MQVGRSMGMLIPCRLVGQLLPSSVGGLTKRFHSHILVDDHFRGVARIACVTFVSHFCGMARIACVTFVSHFCGVARIACVTFASHFCGVARIACVTLLWHGPHCLCYICVTLLRHGPHCLCYICVTPLRTTVCIIAECRRTNPLKRRGLKTKRNAELVLFNTFPIERIDSKTDTVRADVVCRL